MIPRNSSIMAEKSERQVIVEGFEERGGILKLKQQKQEEEKIGYAPWDQTPAWLVSNVA
jgi:hypothetical protein